MFGKLTETIKKINERWIIMGELNAMIEQKVGKRVKQYAY